MLLLLVNGNKHVGASEYRTLGTIVAGAFNGWDPISGLSSLLFQGTKFMSALGTLKNSLMGPLKMPDEPVTTVSTIRLRSACEAGAGSLKRVITSTSAKGFWRTNCSVRDLVPCG
jgi:hypothetical protein